MIIYRPVKWERNKDRRLTQSYGNNFKYKWKRMYWEIVKARDSHKWLDYWMWKPWQTWPCYSCWDWEVTFAWWKDWRWNCVYITQWDYEVVYAHLTSITCKIWAIKSFDEVGIIWNTGNWDWWIHLHFWLRKVWWQWEDPTLYISNWEYPIIDISAYKEIIDAGIFNWEMGEWITNRIAILINKLYKDVKGM